MKMNLPNKLTILRIVMVPFFVFFLLADFVPHRYLFALILFCAASYTDHLDGKIARRDNLITNFGKLMDPLADKILVMSALICLVKLDLASAVCVILIMLREFAVTSVRLLAVEQGRVIAANNWGKAQNRLPDDRHHHPSCSCSMCAPSPPPPWPPATPLARYWSG